MATFNEMYDGDQVRGAYREIADWIRRTGLEALGKKQREAETLFRRIGITFAVYGESGEPAESERLIPFDVVPRVFTGQEWQRIDAGVRQRARALNLFLGDVYRRGEIIKAGVIPAGIVYRNTAYLPAAAGFTPARGVYSHIVGVDLVRVGPDELFVLEDNCRTPSGVSYMLENREIMMRMLPELFTRRRISPVADYPALLRRTLASLAPPACEREPCIVILTPGVFNSAYYEHSFLADQMGVELVEGQDLYVDDGVVYMRTTQGPQRVDVIYRRIDDEFLDPLSFRSDSLLGVPGLFNAYRSGKVSICSAPGTGVADDKAIYTYVPDMIRFYLGESPILANVPTWRCAEPDALAYVLAHLDELVVKEVHGSGGYGMLIGPAASAAELEACRARLKAAPGNYIAQPTLALSSCPTYVDNGIAPRHVDLRPFCLVGDEIRLVRGGLTRVALTEGSLVVNSSQGGGVKDTWVLDD
ncbi:MAG: circularly permuted type 2 ATP-grasp protein [Burkholderiaceae bacterium]